jgi:hypothetical protein
MTHTARIGNACARGAHITLTDDTPCPEFSTVTNGRVLVRIGDSNGQHFAIYDGDDRTVAAMLDIVEYQLAARAFRCSCRPYCECPDRPDFPSTHHARSRGNGSVDFYTWVPLNRVGSFLERLIVRPRVDLVDAFGCDVVEANAVLDCWRQSTMLRQQALAAEHSGDTAAAVRLQAAADEAASDEHVERAVRSAQLNLEIEGMREDLRALTALRHQQLAAAATKATGSADEWMWFAGQRGTNDPQGTNRPPGQPARADDRRPDPRVAERGGRQGHLAILPVEHAP